MIKAADKSSIPSSYGQSINSRWEKTGVAKINIFFFICLEVQGKIKKSGDTTNHF